MYFNEITYMKKCNLVKLSSYRFRLKFIYKLVLGPNECVKHFSSVGVIVPRIQYPHFSFKKCLFLSQWQLFTVYVICRDENDYTKKTLSQGFQKLNWI